MGSRPREETPAVLLSLPLMGTALLLVLPVELPDKTMLATLLLTTRYRSRPVWAGVVTAFAVQCVIAVAFGSALTLLPARGVAAVVALLFGIGAAVLLREGFAAGTAADDAAPVRDTTTPAWRVTAISFGVLFAAEWGDASQLATAALVARNGAGAEAALSVGLGAWLALVIVATVAVLVGRRIAHRLPTRWIQRVAGVVFAVFALVALAEAVAG